MLFILGYILLLVIALLLMAFVTALAYIPSGPSGYSAKPGPKPKPPTTGSSVTKIK